jgi:hypothetical protein
LTGQDYEKKNKNTILCIHTACIIIIAVTRLAVLVSNENDDWSLLLSHIRFILRLLPQTCRYGTNGMLVSNSIQAAFI